MWASLIVVVAAILLHVFCALPNLLWFLVQLSCNIFYILVCVSFVLVKVNEGNCVENNNKVSN